jgi:tight adherence protein C
MTLDPRLLVAALSAIGVVLLGLAILRQARRMRMAARLRALGVQAELSDKPAPGGLDSRAAVNRLGAWLASHWPGQAGTINAQVERAGLQGRVAGRELLGWKAVGLMVAVVLGGVAVTEYQWQGVLMLAVLVAVGWFGIDLALARYHAIRRRAILRDLPTIMDLLVLSMEAGMGLDRALRTVVHEYQSPLADEIQHVLTDVELGIRRGEAFARMAARVGLDELQGLSRAIVQSEELGVSLVGVIQTQSREVRLARRREAEAEALRAPIKMLFPLAAFILPTLFMLLLGPVLLRAGSALAPVMP